MNILITGVCGFIRFSLAEELMKTKNTIIGVDNINNYYFKRLKQKRLSILKYRKNFKFILADINNYKKIVKETKKIKNIFVSINIGVKRTIN